MPRRHPCRQRGTVYLLVLSITAMLVATAVTAVIVGRIDLKGQTLEEDQTQARVLARTGLDLVRVSLNQDADWRTRQKPDTWVGPATVGAGSVRYKLLDDGDGDLLDDPADAVRVYVEATVGDAVRIYSVVLRTGGDVTVEVPVATSTDDAGQGLLGITTTGTNDMLIGTDGLVTGIAAVRFDNLPLGQGYTVLSAQVQFTSNDVHSEATAISIQAQAADDAPTFNRLAYNIASRPKTTAQAVWAPGRWALDARGAEQLTPELSAVMQEVVDRSGWQSGNAVAFFFEGTKARNPRTLDHSAADAPVLHLTYADPRLSADYTTLRRELAE